MKIQTHACGAIRWLCLDVPARLNALDEEMLEAIEQHIAAWERDAVTVVVLGSTTVKAFCVGADIERLAAFDAAAMQRWELLGSRVMDRIRNSPLISIASISRYALGGGLTLALACDFRICSTDAEFGQPEVELGWIPGWGGIARLREVIGVARAKELCMTGARIAAEEAKRMGLVNVAVEAHELEAKTGEFAESLAKQSPGALRAIKAIADARGQEAHQLDAFANSWLLQDEGGRAAIARFLGRKASKGSRR